MAAIGVEVVDTAVIAARDGVRLAASPGVALIAPSGTVVGEAAAVSLRLQPVLAADRFWSDLSQDALAGATERAVSHADLVHAHLGAVWQSVAAPGDEAVFAVPGSMRPRQLGLLLGIASSLGIPVAGAVDAAVAACAGLEARSSVLHLDVQFHQAVLTELAGHRVLRRRHVEIAPRVGLKAMYGAWAQLVSEAMVRRTRFDPLHQAASEQQLYDRLPDWLDALVAAESVDAVVESATGSYSATVGREQFTLAAEAWYAQLDDLVRGALRADEPTTLALTSRAARLPALAARLAAARNLEVARLPDLAAAAGAALRAEEIRTGEQPALVLALARSHAVPGGGQRRVASPATHVIQGGRAHAISDEGLEIGFGPGAGRRISLGGAGAGISRRHCTLERAGGRTRVRDHSRYGTFVNGERVRGDAELGAGDRLRVGSPGVVFELVAVD
ncbi:MAG TPA: FHA domain-containing protein [Steroidobacteraceae bacterium]|nr:FHA domain-containing protein [Steroidobacteraceae bacterium]